MEYPVQRRRGVGTLITGIMLMVLVAPVILGVSIWWGADHAVGAARGQVVGRGESVHLREHRSIDVDAAGDEEAYPGETCTVTGPSGPVTFFPYGGSEPDVTDPDAPSPSHRYTRTSIGSFTTATEGDYRVSCGDRGQVEVTDTEKATRGIIAGVGASMLGLLLAGLAGLVGLILLIVGAVQMSQRPRPPAPPGYVAY